MSNPQWYFSVDLVVAISLGSRLQLWTTPHLLVSGASLGATGSKILIKERFLSKYLISLQQILEIFNLQVYIGYNSWVYQLLTPFCGMDTKPTALAIQIPRNFKISAGIVAMYLSSGGILEWKKK